jgi:hypothetical protein
LNRNPSFLPGLLPSFAALAALFAFARPAAAFDTDFGGSDFKVRWDNTMRANLGIRTTAPDSILGANPAFTAGEYSFGQGGITTSRLDLLSELDASYEGQFGARASFAGWYDLAYQNHTVKIDPSLQAAGVPSGYGAAGSPLSTYALDRYRGPWGEFLDAFGWARFDAGPVPITVKAGRHSIYWGESLLLGGAIHGVAYSQVPLDLIKGFANPGTEIKELYRPLGQISATAQVTPELQLAGQYFLEWQSYLYPEAGTFVGPADFAFNGPYGQYARLGPNSFYFKNGGSRDSRQHDWGAAARYTPGFIDGTVGLYYRRYADKLAAVLLVPNPGGQGPMSPTLNSPFQYQQFYGEGVDLAGISSSRAIAGISTSMEAVYRHNTPLAAQPLGLTTPPSAALAPVLFPDGLPKNVGNSYQARGDTFHLVANALGTLPPSALWSIATWNVEGTYSRLVTVRENQDMFFGMGYGVCRSNAALTNAGLAKNKNDGCATENAAGVGASFTPTWYQVFSGVDLLMPLNGSLNFWGNSPVTLGGNAGSGTYSAGLGADIRNTLRLDVKYIGFYGNTLDNGKTVTSSNGLLSLLKNRESVVFTAKTTF